MIYMAEGMINLTSFKRRLVLDNFSETVGGPIDIAFISKGDGFIWIKRKSILIKKWIMFLQKITSIRKVNKMKNKVLNEYYKDYLKKISKDNIEKYNNERKENSDSSNKKNEKKK